MKSFKPLLLWTLMAVCSLVAVQAKAGTEIGDDDFKISQIGDEDDSATNVVDYSDVAYNPDDNEYLVVWSGDDVDGEFKIWGQIVSGSGNISSANDPFVISELTNADDDAYQPAVVYNSGDNEYLVVWSGDNENDDFLINNELEIFGQRVDVDGDLIDDFFQISTTGSDGSTTFEAKNPDVAYDSENGQYLVVWSADDTDEDFEIFGSILGIDDTDDIITVEAAEIAVSSTTTVDADAETPKVAFNPEDEEYLVVWSSDQDNDEAFEIWGAVLDQDGNTDVDATPISDMGEEDAADPTDFDATEPAVTYNSQDNQYFVTWTGNDDFGVDGVAGAEDLKIWGQILEVNSDVELVAVFSGDFQISNLPDDAQQSDVTYDSLNNQYAVTWNGKGVSYSGTESWIQVLNADGSELEDEYELSDMGTEDVDDSSFNATYSRIVYNSADNSYLVVWTGNNDSPADLDEGKLEVWGQLYQRAKCGNSVEDNDESCDDGNLTDGDGCDSSCEEEEVVAACGDGTIDSGEECDDNNTTAGDGCDASCLDETTAGTCGDGTVDTGETCDDDNTTAGDGCSELCATEEEESSSDSGCQLGNSSLPASAAWAQLAMLLGASAILLKRRLS